MTRRRNKPSQTSTSGTARGARQRSKDRGPSRTAALESKKQVGADAEVPAPGAEALGVRLQKVMAAAGVGSRRACEELIAAGRVEVDRQTVTELGTRVDPAEQEIRVDGVPILRKSARRAGARKICFALYKPVGVICTNNDPAGRMRVIDLLPPGPERLFTIGRLDQGSEGLILVTNDGELAERLAHPRFGVQKKYEVLVAGIVEPETIDKLRKGVHLAEGVVRVVSVRIKRTIKKSTVLEIVLAEGLNREIRRALARLEHKVMRLRRVAIGPLTLGKLAPGEHRLLQGAEIEALRRGETSIGYRERPHRAGRRRRPKQAGAPRTSRNEGRQPQAKGSRKKGPPRGAKRSPLR